MANFVQVSTDAGADYVPVEEEEEEEDLPELKDESETKIMAEADDSFVAKPFPRLEPANHPTVRELFARFASSGARFYPHATVVDLPSHRMESHRYRVFPEDNKLVSDPLPNDCILDDPVPGDSVNQEDVYSAYAFWDFCTHRVNVLQIIVNVYQPRSSQ